VSKKISVTLEIEGLEAYTEQQTVELLRDMLSASHRHFEYVYDDNYEGIDVNIISNSRFFTR
jgi:hypothetical protein